MLVIRLLLSLILWLSVEGMIREINVIAGRTVFVNDDLPKQSSDDLERKASAMRNSFCEIMKPEFDYEGKVRLRWFGDQQICGAVRRRYLHRVPVVYVHFIEDKDESEYDLNLALKYLDNLAQKLRRDVTQSVTTGLTSIHQRIDNLHVVTNLSYAEYHQNCLDIHHRRYSADSDSETVKRVLDRQLIPIPHRIHVNTEESDRCRELTINIARGVSSKQSYYPLQHPAVRIHLFPNEHSFVRYGGELHDELMADPKQVVMMAAPDSRQHLKYVYFWHRAQYQIRSRLSLAVKQYLLVEHIKTLSDRHVLEDSSRWRDLARVIHPLLRRMDEQGLQWILESMRHSHIPPPPPPSHPPPLPELPLPPHLSNSPFHEWTLTSRLEPALLREMGRKIMNLKRRMNTQSDPLYGPWKKEHGQKMNLEEKSKRIDIFMRVWDEIVLKELVLCESDQYKLESFWMSFGIVARKRFCYAQRNVVDAMASTVVPMWRAIDHYLDPSYSINVLLFGGLDMEQSLLQDKCLEFGYSWKALRASIKWIDCDDADAAITA